LQKRRDSRSRSEEEARCQEALGKIRCKKEEHEEIEKGQEETALTFALSLFETNSHSPEGFSLGAGDIFTAVFFGQFRVSGLLPGHVPRVVMELAVGMLAGLLFAGFLLFAMLTQVRIVTIVPRQGGVNAQAPE
jgi:hypothetical protein